MRLAIGPLVSVKDVSQSDVVHGVAGQALAIVRTNEHQDSVLAVNGVPSVGVGSVDEVRVGVSADVVNQSDVAGVLIVLLNEHILLAVRAVGVDVSQGVAGSGVGEYLALLQAVSSAVVGGNGNLLGTSPSGDYVYGAVSGAGLLLNVLQNNCVVLGRTAGALVAQVDECSLCIVAVAGLVSNCGCALDVAIVASSSLTGYYLVGSIGLGVAIALTNTTPVAS